MKATLVCVAFAVLLKSTSAEPVGKCSRDMKSEGVDYLVDSEDKTVFYKCDFGMPVKNVCPDGLHFSNKLNVCDLPELSDRKGDSGSNESSGSSSSSSEGGSGENPGGKCPNDPCPLENGEFPVYFPHPETCTRFCQCDWGVAYDMECPDGLHFNTELNVCDWPEVAGCEGSGGTPSAKPPTSGEGCGSSESESSEEPAPTQPPKPPTSGASSGSSESGSSEEPAPTQPPKPPTSGGSSGSSESGSSEEPAPTQPPKPPTSGGSSGSSESGSSEEPAPTQPPKPTTSGGSSGSSESGSGSSSSGSGSDENGGSSGGKCPNDPCPSVNGQFPVYFAHPETCTRFCQCDWGVAHDMPCPDGLHFNTKINVCDWPAAAGCA